MALCGGVRCFNPRARTGATCDYTDLLKWTQQFQSTRPRGARPLEQIRVVTGVEVSIHAPNGRARRPADLTSDRFILFQSTHRYERDTAPTAHGK